MSKSAITKDQLRSFIKRQKLFYSKEQLRKWSDDIRLTLLSNEFLKHSNTILLYSSLRDEVDTCQLIEELAKEKQILLPVVDSDKLKLCVYNHHMIMGPYHIMEPQGPEYVDYDNIDLAIVPGTAFDKNKNRLGRGKGYYDKLLPLVKAKKIGICFGFQLVDKVPCEEHDIMMDFVITENGYQ